MKPGLAASLFLTTLGVWIALALPGAVPMPGNPPETTAAERETLRRAEKIRGILVRGGLELTPAKFYRVLPEKEAGSAPDEEGPRP